MTIALNRQNTAALSLDISGSEIFSVTEENGQFLLQSRRYGHGVGMSQRGAQQMANMGYTYDQILGFYYENCVRMQYTFTHTILPPVGDAPVTATEAPATISPAAPNQAMVTLVNVEDVLNVRIMFWKIADMKSSIPPMLWLLIWSILTFQRLAAW